MRGTFTDPGKGSVASVNVPLMVPETWVSAKSMPLVVAPAVTVTACGRAPLDATGIAGYHWSTNGLLMVGAAVRTKYAPGMSPDSVYWCVVKSTSVVATNVASASCEVAM